MRWCRYALFLADGVDTRWISSSVSCGSPQSRICAGTRLQMKSHFYHARSYPHRFCLGKRFPIEWSFWLRLMSTMANRYRKQVLPYVAVCCSALQCVAVYCSILQCFAVWCSVLPDRMKILSNQRCSPLKGHCIVSQQVWTKFLSSERVLYSLKARCSSYKEHYILSKEHYVFSTELPNVYT